MPVKIKSDPKRVKQILFNLVGNALKFTDEGYVKVKAELLQPDMREENENKAQLRFKIIDSGIGIAEEDIAKLFRMFGKLESSSEKNVHGAGLGLNISKMLSQEMGGDITV